LPLPDARRDRRYGIFDAPVDHAKAPHRLSPAFNPKISLKIVNNY
jgi:hypothetical protein